MTLSRRHLFHSTAALAALNAGMAAAHAAAPLSKTQAPGFYRYMVGELELTAVHDGFYSRPLDGLVTNAPLKTVEDGAAAMLMPTDRLVIPFTTTVVNTGSRLVVIDTGNGNSGAVTSGQWMTNFRAAGFTPEQVDTVILSHFHGDHINGLRLKDGTAVFPGAEIMVPAAEWAYWMDDAKMASAPDGLKGAFGNVRRVFGPMANDVKQYTPDRELVTGLTAIAAPGHTPGHTAFAVTSGAGRLLLLSDTTNHPALFARNPEWSGVFDIDPEMARTTRRRMLELAVAERMQVAFYHAPFPATGYLTRSGSGFEFLPKAWSSTV